MNMSTLRPHLKGWQKLILGILGLAIVIAFFSSGYSPPGLSGEVLRHNQENDIDASPLIYSEVEHMAELEAGVKALRDSAACRQNDSCRQAGGLDTTITAVTRNTVCASKEDCLGH